MKKLFALVLSFALALSMAACTPTDNKETTGDTTPVETPAPTTTEAAPVAASALEILETVWGQFGDDEKFPTMGGDYEAIVDGAPGAVKDTGFMTGTLLVPEAETANVSEAASLVHGMMLNNFTCGAFKVTDAAAFAEAMYGTISTNPWMCGMPEKMVIATIGGEFVVAMFGVNGAVEPFEAKLTAAYPTVEIVYSEAITG